MKIIGKAKGKKSSTWCLVRDTRTGIIYEDYVGDWPVSGKPDEIRTAVAKAFTKRYPKPAVPGIRPPHPTVYKWEVERRGGKLTPEQEKTWNDHEAYNVAVYAHHMWTQHETLAHLEPIECDSVFKAELRFTGYTRGRSSVTMKFEAENGQEIQFGPSGINNLIDAMIEGKVPNIPLTGTYEQEEWDPQKEELVKVVKPRLRGIEATFKFVKKGQNVYAELVEDWV